MAQRRKGEREPIVETFLDSNEEISDMGDRKRRRYSQLMARFKRDTMTWNLSQRRRFCGHANSLLRTLKKPERLELHYCGNKLIFRVALVDVRRRKNNENERRIEDHEDRENLNLEDNEIVVRQGDKRCVKRVYRHTTRQQKRGNTQVAETSELSVLRVEINNKDRAIRKKNLEIRSEKRNFHARVPAFCTFAKMTTIMKIIMTELPLESKPMKLVELHKEAVNGVKNLWGIRADAPLGDVRKMMDAIVLVFPRLVENDLILSHKNDTVFVSVEAEASFFQSLEKLRTDLEQLREDKGGIGDIIIFFNFVIFEYSIFFSNNSGKQIERDGAKLIDKR